ncbi:MAG: hypothetical protein JJU11_09095 [Candidatus Sumerlaeia bacterium]|nr:hypothetical protein [Candidatus Sumerlaeia bacterium]
MMDYRRLNEKAEKKRKIEKWGAIAFVVLGLLWVGGYFFVAYTSEYEGTIVELDRSLRWDRIFDETRPDRVRYRHYAVIEEPDGNQRRVRITYYTHARAEIGDPLLKVRGERFGRLMSQEAIDARETSAEAMGMIYDAMTQEREEPAD